MAFIAGAIARLLGQTVNVNFSASTGWGSQPAQLTLTCPVGALDAVASQVTTLTIGWGGAQGTSIVFRDVLIRSVDTAEPGDAGLMRVTMLDRRWRWQFGVIDGDYNVLKKDKSLKRPQTPQQLAGLLAAAMGEPALDVTALPNAARPRKAWRAANPRQELDRLCGDLGCVVAFDGPGDRAYVVQPGQGLIPADFGPQISRTSGATIPPWPSQIRVAGGPVLFQTELILGEVVGEDTDGKIKRVLDLSYFPVDGWKDPYHMLDIEGTYIRDGETHEVRELAAKSVFRWYRVTGQSLGGWSPAALVGGPYAPSSLDDLGPFLDTRLDRDEATGNRLPAIVFGVFSTEFDERESGANTVPGTRYRGLFRFNQETKCVEFNEPVFKWGSADGSNPPMLAASIYIYIGYSCSKNGVPVRYERFLDNAGQSSNYNGGVRVEHHEEIVREVAEQRPFDFTGDDNLTKVDAEANHYLNAIAAEYQNFPSVNPVLPGIQYYAPSGVLRQIQWQGSSTAAPTTQLAYNGELNEFMPDFRDTPEARARRVAEQAARERAALVNGRLGPPKE